MVGEQYEIRRRGRLSERWAEHFAPLRMRLLDEGDTLLQGAVADQPQFFGLLQRIRDLNSTLVYVMRIQKDETGGNPLNPFLLIDKPEPGAPAPCKWPRP